MVFGSAYVIEIIIYRDVRNLLIKRWKHSIEAAQIVTLSDDSRLSRPGALHGLPIKRPVKGRDDALLPSLTS